MEVSNEHYEDAQNGVSDFQDAINTYYKLKSEYDKEKKDMVRKISRKTHLSKKEKRKEFQKAKYKCINCRRSVGSLFNITFDKEKETRIAKAMCGDRLNPCPLNIEIDLGAMKNVSQELRKFEKEISDLKQKVVLIKNDIIFGYSTTEDAVVSFNEIKDELTYATEAYETLLISYVEIYERPTEKKEAQATELEIYHDIQAIKNMVTDFNKENNINYIKDAATMYVTQLIPKLKKYRDLKYSNTFTEHVNQQCVLNQQVIDMNNTQINHAMSEQRVVSMVTGNVQSQKEPKRNRTSIASTTSTSK